MPVVFIWVYISNILCVYKQRLSEQILDIWAIKNRTEESLSLGPATDHLLPHSTKVMDTVMGKGHFQGPGEPQEQQQHQTWCSCSRRTRRCRTSWHCAHHSQSSTLLEKSWVESTDGQAPSLEAICSFKKNGAIFWCSHVFICSSFRTWSA